MMKKVFAFAFCALVLCSALSFAQTPSMPNAPYRNLAVWYGTQAAPAPLEKARWGLDDVNSYRTSRGYPALPESILEGADIDSVFASSKYAAAKRAAKRGFRLFR